MKKNHFQKIIVATLLALSFVGCAKGLQTLDSSEASDSTGNSSQGTGTPTTPTAPAIDQVDMKSRVEDSSNQTGFNGALAFDFDKTRGEFIIMVPLPGNLMFTPSGSFTNYPDITFGPQFDASGKMRIAVRVPVKYVLKGVQFVPPARLPNGDPLPAMPAGIGELPSLGLNFPNQNNTQINLYLGINAIGLFVSLPDNATLPIPFNITLPLKNQDKSRTFGYLTYVAAKSSFSSGLFISTGVPPQFARILEDYFHL
jgi:hypothetical protein